MTSGKKFTIFFMLILILLFGFYAGKYKAWETDPTKQVSTGTFFKDWHISMILGLMVVFALMSKISDAQKPA